MSTLLPPASPGSIARLSGRIAALAGALLLAACTVTLPQRALVLSPGPGAGAATQAQYRDAVAQRILDANAARVLHGTPQAMLRSLVVVSFTVDRDRRHPRAAAGADHRVKRVPTARACRRGLLRSAKRGQRRGNALPGHGAPASDPRTAQRQRPKRRPAACYNRGQPAPSFFRTPRHGPPIRPVRHASQTGLRSRDARDPP